jgi:hypothetical protein
MLPLASVIQYGEAVVPVPFMTSSSRIRTVSPDLPGAIPLRCRCGQPVVTWPKSKMYTCEPGEVS